MRFVVVALIVASCGGGESPPDPTDLPDPHEQTACDPDIWRINNEVIPTCEIGCAAGPSPGTDSDGDQQADECPAQVDRPQGCPLSGYTEFEGAQRGCCLVDMSGGAQVEDWIVRFHACTD